MSINQRIKDFAKYKKISIRKFEKMCNLSNGYVGNLNYAIGEDKLLNITQTFPEINPVWLQMGEGKMIKEQLYEKINESPSVLKEPDINPHFENRSIDALSRALDRMTELYGKVVTENESLKEENEELKKAVTAQRGTA